MNEIIKEGIQTGAILLGIIILIGMGVGFYKRRKRRRANR